LLIAKLAIGLISMIAPKYMTFEALPQPWSCIAWYESTDNAMAINQSSGDQGAFQFALTTWETFAPISFPATPVDASLLQQYEVAQIVFSSQGSRAWETWDLCA
jgi:hypothetical protein